MKHLKRYIKLDTTQMELINNDLLAYVRMLGKAKIAYEVAYGEAAIGDYNVYVATDSVYGEIIVHEFDAYGNLLSMHYADNCNSLEEFVKGFNVVHGFFDLE